MNYVAQEMLAIDDILHYGMKYRSGRYPYGSGEVPYQHDPDFLGKIEKKRKENFEFVDENGKKYTGDSAIAAEMGINTSQLRILIGLATAEQRSTMIAAAKSYEEKGITSPTEIAKKLTEQFKDSYGKEINESTVRGWLKEESAAKVLKSRNTANVLKEYMEKHKGEGVLDVSEGIDTELGISKERMEQALFILETEGYKVYTIGQKQVTNKGQQTRINVLCPPGTTYAEAYNLPRMYMNSEMYSPNDGKNYFRYEYPASLDSKRLSIKYAEDGGTDKDGVVEIRPGVTDLSLGDSKYAQVRILVDGTHYIKGMAVYATDSDKWPKGVDLVFNTNKSNSVSKMNVLKPIKENPEDPFGALIKPNGQYHYDDKDGNQHLGLINKTREEGDWNEWSDRLPSQFLAKQSMELIQKQLGETLKDRKQEYDDILACNNNAVKKKLLYTFASSCDSAAADLSACSLPGQKYKVILPVNSLSDKEVYAPGYQNGSKVALVRFPHGGLFEIPILTVNNKNVEGSKMIGDALDGIGINSNNAGILSGADFDGDTVMVIPTGKNGIDIRNKAPLSKLQGFDPKAEYPERPGMVYMKNPDTKVDNTQREMGIISNLITDMTVIGATDDELARAVKHSMVVIDAAKHKLDYKRSEAENDILSLKKKYQAQVDEKGNVHFGAGTLISKAGSSVAIPKRQGSGRIDPETGKMVYKESGETYIEKSTGKEKIRTQNVEKMYLYDDARALSSGRPKEEAYAQFANTLKSMANKARLEYLATPNVKRDPEAAKKYSEVVNKMQEELRLVDLNKPKERMAQYLASDSLKKLVEKTPEITDKYHKKEYKKAAQQAITKAREQVGASRQVVHIGDLEWEAIQSGAISNSVLTRILDKADLDNVKKYAMPKATTELSSTKINRIKQLTENGYTQEQVAGRLGISVSTVNKYLHPEK